MLPIFNKSNNNTLNKSNDSNESNELNKSNISVSNNPKKNMTKIPIFNDLGDKQDYLTTV